MTLTTFSESPLTQQTCICMILTNYLASTTSPRLYLVLSGCICLYLVVSVCICLYLLVSACICLHLVVSACIWLYLVVSACICLLALPLFINDFMDITWFAVTNLSTTGESWMVLFSWQPSFLLFFWEWESPIAF